MVVAQTRKSVEVGLQQVIYDLVQVYREESYQAHLRGEYKGRVADVLVERGEKEPLLFKVITGIPSKKDLLLKEWKRFDRIDCDWWICAPEDCLDEVEELIEQANLSNVNLCSWDTDHEGEVGFFDLPEIDL